MITYTGAVRTQTLRGYCNITHYSTSHHETTAKFSSNPPISWKIPREVGTIKHAVTHQVKTLYRAYWSQIEKAIPIKCVKHGITILYKKLYLTSVCTQNHLINRGIVGHCLRRNKPFRKSKGWYTHSIVLVLVDLQNTPHELTAS